MLFAKEKTHDALLGVLDSANVDDALKAKGGSD